MNAIYDFVNQHFFYFAISYLFAGWAALGLFFGRHIAVWFPFLLTSRFYLPIPWKRLGRLLTSETTFYWGKKQPRYIHVKYYLVSPRQSDETVSLGRAFLCRLDSAGGFVGLVLHWSALQNVERLADDSDSDLAHDISWAGRLGL